MSSPLPSSIASAQTQDLRGSLPPYAAPVPTGAPVASSLSVGPYVPAAWRRSLPATAPTPATGMPAAVAEAELSVTETAFVAPVQAVAVEFDDSATETVGLMAPAPEAPMQETPVQAMDVPDRIPPYRPLRPTPIMTPAIRTPLYIPAIAVPSAESVSPDSAAAAAEWTESESVDEGVIAPELVTTAEFAVPTSLRPTLSSIEAVAAVEADDQSQNAGEILSMAEAVDAPEPVTPPTLANEGHELPWIDAFLAATPASPMAPVPTPVENAMVLEPVEMPEPQTIEDTESIVDDWPLQDAAEEFRALSAQLEQPVDTQAPDALFAEPTPPVVLPAWGEEDLMDIMPIRHSGQTPLSTPAILSDGDLWAERARKAQEEAREFNNAIATTAAQPESDGRGPEATAEESALALELLARRVRAGELQLPSYDPRMGEQAALVAALAALLGVRLR